MNRYRCPLGTHQVSDRNPEESDRANHDLRKRLHDEHRELCVSIDDQRLDWMQREILKQIGEQLYGDKR